MNAENGALSKKRLSLKWKVFVWLAVFTGVIVLLMWLMQSVFLERIYKSIKMRGIESEAGKLAEVIDSVSEAGRVIDGLAGDGVCVTVCVLSGDGGFFPVYTSHVDDACVIHSIDSESVRYLMTSAEENGGEQFQRFLYDASKRRYIGVTGGFFDKSPVENEDELPESVIFTKICRTESGEDMVIMLNTTISPVGATVDTLNSMLLAMTAVLILLALILALFISRRISRPITGLTSSARKLALGNYDVRFDGGGYREVSELSDALNYAEGELAKTDTLRRELIANVSHDLRTPLTMMIGYGEMMRDIPGENTPENMQVVIDESKRLSSLVDDLLDVSKLESGVGKNEPEVFDLSAAVEKTLSRFAKLCERDGYVVEYYSAGPAPVNADEQRVMQAVYNLVANALTHTGDDKRVTVELSVSNGEARVTVTDTGEGIPADKLPLIWDRYYKVDRVHKRAAAGSGLGLSIVKTVMEQNGGSYAVSSREGVGSSFSISLPICRPEKENG